MLVMEDRRKDVKDILNEELDKLRQRIIENHIQAGQRAALQRLCDDEGENLGADYFGDGV